MWGGSGAVGGELIFALFFLFAAGVLAVLGHAVIVVPGRDNPSLCVRRFIHWLGCSGFLVGGLYWLLTWPASDPPLLGNPLGGLVSGAVLGLVVGTFVWLRLKSVEKEEGS